MRAIILRRRILCAAVLAVVPQVFQPARAGATGSEVTISTGGSTALKNWLVKNTNTFTDIQPGTSLSINGTSYPTDGTSEWEVDGGSAYAYQLAPTVYNSSVIQGQIADQAPAVQFEFHESGSVEGILEMANDQIAPVQYVTQNIDRNPSLGTSSGNAVWVNYNQFGGGKNNWTVAGGGSSNGYSLGDFYSGGQSFVQGGDAQPSFDLAGNNLSGGQNAVQIAFSDALPVQVFASNATGTSPHAADPWFSAVSDPGYGSGNTNLPTAQLGTADSRQVYQNTSVLNMPATTIDPRTGTDFGPGAWNTAGLGNLDSQLVAVTATLFVANPGTGLTEVNRTDAQWLQLQGRLQNGASFDMTTRDTNSGTRNVAALDTGVDPTWAVGVNDDGNGNSASGGLGQITIGPQLRFSNKTAGGNELRPTVQSARMSVGTLSINDANGSTFNNSANPIRALSFSNTDAGQTPDYVAPSYANIIDGAYTIFQNEQVVTLEAPDSNYGTANPDVQGDDSSGDVRTLINNTLDSVAAYNNSNQPASPAAGLMAQGYILPQLMQVRKSENGGAIVPNTVANGAAPGQQYDPSLTPDPNLSNSTTGKMANSDPSTVDQGAASSVYGGNTVNAGGPSGFNGEINLTSSNYLFGDFNQNGVRDYDAVVVEAQKAQAALEAQAGDSAFTADGGSANSAKVVTGIPALDAMTGQDGTVGATKGDLIAMGDYNGDGKFDGFDLYDLAIGASLSDPTARPTETTIGGVTTFTTGAITVPAGENFGQVVDSAVLNKNTALDYLQQNATTSQKQEARAVLTGSTVPAGATNLGTTDPITGLAQFTFDPTGVNSFNKSDVNRDGVVDFNDAVLVDQFNGQDYTNLSDVMDAYQPTPVTGVTEQANLVMVSQTDASTTIGPADLAIMNTALTGVGATNWYGYALTKSGPGAINFGRTGGTVTVTPGANFQINSGVVNVSQSNSGPVAGGIDPFTASTAPSGLDTSQSLPVSVSNATLTYAARTGGEDSGFKLYRLNSLTIGSGGSVVLDSAGLTDNRTLLAVGALSFTAGSGTLDLGANDLVVHNASEATITSQIASGYAGGSWHGPVGLTSSSAAATSNTALGVELNSNGAGGTFLSTFDGQPVTSTDVLVKYTYFGDANLDGVVNGSDYTLIDNGFNNSLVGWHNGDFNYDGIVNGDDYTLIDNAFNTQGLSLASAPSEMVASDTAQIAGGSSPTAVPEPASLSMLTLSAAALLKRRRRH